MSKGYFCESHMDWMHLKCTTFNDSDYERLSISSDDWFSTKNQYVSF